MNFNEFGKLTTELLDIDKDFTIQLTNKHSFHYGTHGSMAGSYRGFWISEKTLIGTPYEGQQNCMDTTNYTINDFYIFMTEHNLLTNFKFKIEEAILKEI
jgi:hypothetical protein